MKESQLQTPQRDPSTANRRTKSTPDVKANLNQVTRKSLVPELTNVREESPKKVSDQSAFTKSNENLLAKVNPDPVLVTTPGTSVVSDLKSPSSATTCEKNVILDESEVDSYKVESIEVEMVMNCLREARNRVLKSENLGYSRKLLDALISVIVEEYCDGVCEEKKWLDKLLSSKFNLVFMTYTLGVLVMFVVWFFNQGAGGILTGPPPT